MSLDLNNLEIKYKQLLEISTQIGELIERELYSDLIGYIEKKDQILQEASALIKRVLDKSEDASQIKELAEKIQAQELKNIESLSKIKDEIKEKLHKNSKDKKIINAYNTVNSNQGNILDFRE